MIFQRQVVYLITSPLSKRDFERLGIQNWNNRGWVVKVFDFTKFLKPEFWDHVDGEKLSIAFEGLTIFDDLDFALASIENLEDGNVFIDLIFPSRAGQKIRQAAKKKGITLKLKLGTIPVKQSDSSIFFNVVQKALKNPVGFFPKVVNKIRQFREDAPDYFVVGGNASLLNTSKGNPFIIKAHNFDYDFLITENTPEIDQKDGEIVFLDGDDAFHSDYVHSGTKPYVTAECYYPAINDCLSQIGEALNYDIKIAAHPRSDYDKKSFKYSFPILKDQTFELIKQASLVVSHGSTAVQWAVLMKKPIIILITDEMEKNSFVKSSINFMASELGKHAINVNKIPEDFDWEQQMYVNEMKYQNYVETYVKQSGTPEKQVWDIVIDRMETDFFYA